MDLILLVGFLGALGVLIGWIPETIRNIEKHKTGLHEGFAILYAAGSILLFIYAYVIKDIVFMILNGLIAIMAIINLYLRLRYRK